MDGRTAALSLFAAVTFALVGCGAALPEATVPEQAPAPRAEVEAASPPIDAETYAAVLDTVFDGLQAEAEAAAAQPYRSAQEARLAAAPFLQPRFGERMTAALEVHDVTPAQMSEFAMAHHDTVRDANTHHATRMLSLRPTTTAILDGVDEFASAEPPPAESASAEPAPAESASAEPAPASPNHETADGLSAPAPTTTERIVVAAR